MKMRLKMNKKIKTRSNFLPVTSEDVSFRGWDGVDIVIVTGDAYVDHPSFGAAIIGRVLEAAGCRVAVLSQPKEGDFERFQRPKLAFFVSAGNLDSMVAHYTAAKRKRSDDKYSPGGKAGYRPDRALNVYCRRIRSSFGNVPIIIGGLEASLRRFAHYDYWDDCVMPSIMEDCKADLLVYGMGEKQSLEIYERLKNGEDIKDLKDIKGTCYLVETRQTPWEGIECPSFDNVRTNKKEYARACKIQHDENDHVRAKIVKQRQKEKMLVQNPAMPPLTQEEFDQVYDLPFSRLAHPDYGELGGVPALEEVEHSIIHNRGCFGDCNFCSISFHQGRTVTGRSKESVIKEAKKIIADPAFKGYIHDIGGPTANFRHPPCKKQEKSGACKDKRCLAPKVCENLRVDHSEYSEILKSVRELEGVKKVFIRSGIRYDYLLADKDDNFFADLIEHHISGQLKVAPEHCAPNVLDKMGKPHIEAYLKFARKFYTLTKQAGKEQYLVPYFISSHPGSRLEDAIELALFLKKEGIRPQQVQDFYPTPGTVSTCMFYTSLDPFTLEEVYVAKDSKSKAMQRALLQYFEPKNKGLVISALKKANRFDLIGPGENCLLDYSRKNSRRSQGKKRRK